MIRFYLDGVPCKVKAARSFNPNLIKIANMVEVLSEGDVKYVRVGGEGCVKCHGVNA